MLSSNIGRARPTGFNWTRDLPSVDVHYRFADSWSAYVQYAKGFLAPNLNTLYVPNPEENQLRPEATTNLQAGATWVGPVLTVSADVYTINFSNLLQKQSDGPNDTFFYNLGGVKYRGVEAEGTYVAGAGFSVYANGSYNSARLTADNTWVPLTPVKTAALGVLYNQGSLQGSLIEKYVGRRYGDAEDAYPLGSYATGDVALNYLIGPMGALLKDAKVGITLQNLTDRKSIYFLNGYTNGSAPAGYVNGNPLFFRLPGRSFQVNLSASF